VGNADILLSFSQQDIYCEVASFQSIIKALESKGESEDIKIQKRLQKLRKAQPWLTKQDVEEEFEINRAVRNLLDKTKRQLSPNHPGILALDTAKSVKFAYKIRLIADSLLRQRLQIALIVLWSLEGDAALDWGENPSSFFINGRSEFRKIAEALLKHLGLKGEVVGA
jgi:hypothetical protein